MDFHNSDPLQPHHHEPNYEVPPGDGAFTLEFPDGEVQTLAVNHLQGLPYTELYDCYIVSTGHGTSGPFVFGGVRLIDVVEAVIKPSVQWQQVEVISADGFGNRLYRFELLADDYLRPPLLAIRKDGEALAREDGLVRLIVPTEQDDALRQVKWVATVRVR